VVSALTAISGIEPEARISRRHGEMLVPLLANADAATFNLLRRGWSIPSDNIDRIVDRTLRRRTTPDETRRDR